MIRTDARRLPAVVPDAMVVRDRPIVELPRKARSDDLAYATSFPDVQDAGAGTVLRSGPQPAAIGSFDVSEQALSERESSAGTDAGRATAERPPSMICSKPSGKRLLANFTDDLVSGHRHMAERVRWTADPLADRRYTPPAAMSFRRHNRSLLSRRPTHRT